MINIFDKMSKVMTYYGYTYNEYLTSTHTNGVGDCLIFTKGDDHVNLLTACCTYIHTMCYYIQGELFDIQLMGDQLQRYRNIKDYYNSDKIRKEIELLGYSVSTSKNETHINKISSNAGYDYFCNKYGIEG